MMTKARNHCANINNLPDHYAVCEWPGVPRHGTAQHGTIHPRHGTDANQFYFLHCKFSVRFNCLLIVLVNASMGLHMAWPYSYLWRNIIEANVCKTNFWLSDILMVRLVMPAALVFVFRTEFLICVTGAIGFKQILSRKISFNSLRTFHIYSIYISRLTYLPVCFDHCIHMAFAIWLWNYIYFAVAAQHSIRFDSSLKINPLGCVPCDGRPMALRSYLVLCIRQLHKQSHPSIGVQWIIYAAEPIQISLQNAMQCICPRSIAAVSETMSFDLPFHSTSETWLNRDKVRLPLTHTQCKSHA